MIASDRRGHGECDSDHGTTNGDSDMTSGRRQRAKSNSDKQCADDASAIEYRHPYAESDN